MTQFSQTTLVPPTNASGSAFGQTSLQTATPPKPISPFPAGLSLGNPIKDSLKTFLERRDQKIIDLGLAEGNDNTAELCWGGQNKNPRAQLPLTTFNTRKSKDDQPDKPADDKVFQWKAQEKFVVKTKITNPQDPEQYIWVNVCRVMVMTAPSQDPFNGKKHIFDFQAKETIVAVDEGGNK